MPDISVTASEIKNLLQNLNVHKATGPDEIGTRVLNETSDMLAPILEIIFNNFLNTGAVPNNWKMANVTPSVRKVTDLNLITTDLSF